MPGPRCFITGPRSLSGGGKVQARAPVKASSKSGVGLKEHRAGMGEEGVGERRH